MEDNLGTLEKLAPEEIKFLLELIRQADISNISELQYRSVRVKFFPPKPNTNGAKTVKWDLLPPGAR